MENKEIYIDGVDVSGCGWYTQGATGMICADWHLSNDCSKNPNCYYKQLKAKEQECEELKNIINEAKNSKLDLKSFLVGEAVQNEYEQQIDQIKEQLEAYKMEADEGKEINAELKAENDELKEELEELKEENEYNEANAIEFKQTLVEICLNVETLRLNIGGIEIMWNNNPEEWQDDILQDFATCRRLIQEIQQKISEVLK